MTCRFMPWRRSGGNNRVSYDPVDEAQVPPPASRACRPGTGNLDPPVKSRQTLGRRDKILPDRKASHSGW
jgi:hypothetical protein